MVQSLPRVVRSNRIPPHNLDAEQSVLGAMLESREAIANVLEILDPEDFYKPAHATIYEAILGLFGKGEPVDAITVADELTRRGHLEGIGGKPYIHGLLEAYPTASSAAHYARIVDEHAMLRRLVSAGNEIQEIGFSLPDDVPQAVDRSEELIYEVGNRRLRGDVAPLRGLLTEAMVDIETLYERGEPITGVTTGFHDLDEITTGFQPANLVIVAARPSMGKCLRGSTLIDDPRTGERITIKDFVERRSLRIMNVAADGSVVETEVTDWVPNGQRECWRLTTRSGRTIVATDNHPFLKVGGWTPLSELEVGDRIAVPREVPVFGDCDWSSDRIRLLAYFIAEGGLTGGLPRFTNVDPVIVEDFERCVYEEFESCVVSRFGVTYTARSIRGHGRGCNEVTNWLKSLGLMGKSALEKRFPDVVWTF
ncbi:MAG: intein-containing replicative DNA helicase, partial [Actinobacteria bacterium]|nr:intein-containing replicative DNA helicase [Actinomycetota bacterium]